MNKKFSDILRWIGFIPLSFLGGCLSYFILAYFINETSFSKSFLGTVINRVISFIVMSYLIYYIVPQHKLKICYWISIILAVIQFILGALLVILTFNYGETDPLKDGINDILVAVVYFIITLKWIKNWDTEF